MVLYFDSILTAFLMTIVYASSFSLPKHRSFFLAATRAALCGTPSPDIPNPLRLSIASRYGNQ
jgi:hypothetical protein